MTPPEGSTTYSLAPSPWHRFKVAGIGLVVLAGAITALALAETPTERLMGYVGLVFFSCCLAGYLLLLALGRPRLDLDADGIYIQLSFADGLRLAWRELEHIEQLNLMGQDMIRIQPRTDVDWRQRLSRFARLVSRVNHSMGMDGLLIARVNLGDRYDLAFTALVAGLDQSRRGHGMKP